MGAQWPGDHVHPRDPGRERIGRALFGGCVGAQPAQGEDQWRRVGPGVVALAGLGARFQIAPHVIEQAHKKSISTGIEERGRT